MIDDQIGEALGQVEAGLLKGIQGSIINFHFDFFLLFAMCIAFEYFIFMIIIHQLLNIIIIEQEPHLPRNYFHFYCLLCVFAFGYFHFNHY